MSGRSYGTAAKSGAQAYQATGNPYIAAIAAVIGFFQGRKEDKEMKREYEEQFRLMKKYNEMLLQEQARGISEINRQRTITNIQTAQAMVHYAKQASGMSGANAAAIAQSDARGTASVMLEAEVLRQESEAKALSVLNLETQHDNYNVTVDTLSNQTKQQFADPMQLLQMEHFKEGTNLTEMMESGMNMYSGMKGGGGGGSAKSSNSNSWFQGSDFTTSQGYNFSYDRSKQYGFSSSTGKKGLFG